MKFLKWYSFIVLSLCSLLTIGGIIYGIRLQCAIASKQVTSPLGLYMLLGILFFLCLPPLRLVFLTIRLRKVSKFLKIYSTLTLSYFVISSLLNSKRDAESIFFAIVLPLLLIPTIVYLWTILLHRSIKRKNEKWKNGDVLEKCGKMGTSYKGTSYKDFSIHKNGLSLISPCDNIITRIVQKDFYELFKRH